MSRPTKLDQGFEGWIREHSGWQREGTGSVFRTYEFASFPAAIGFVVELSMLGEKHNHHPDIDIRFKSVRVTWTTHDVDGLTRLDLVLAEATDEILS